MLDLFELETVADPSAANAGAPAGDGPSQTAPAANLPDGAQGGETEPSAVATDTVPAWTPEQIAALRADPDFQAYLSEEASTIADARFQQLLEQNRGTSQAPIDPAGGVDLNEYLDPYGENFGTNLAAVLGGVLQQVTRASTKGSSRSTSRPPRCRPPNTTRSSKPRSTTPRPGSAVCVAATPPCNA